MKTAIPLSRRQFVLGSLTLVGAAPFSVVRAAMPFTADPFALGVASGYPRADGVILWTRLMPDPASLAPLPDGPIPVGWEIAEDDRFGRIVGSGTADAVAGFAHSVHVDVGGLRSGAEYWYRFHVGGQTSPVGRTRTAPAAGSAVERLRFAIASCQQYEQGFFAAYRHMAAQDLDLVVHLGDYIYENSWGRQHVRKHGAGIPTELWEYRERYALYKRDPDLQTAHAAFPWIVTWDDHEVADDYTSDVSTRMHDPAQFLKVRAAAYQAYYENMPLPPSAAPRGPDATIYGRYQFGDMLDLLMLDDRQYRSHHACLAEIEPRLRADCPERLDPARTMFGVEQEAWLDRQLSAGSGRWTVLAQQTLMAPVGREAGPGRSYWMDGWDGYAAPRQRLLDTIAGRKPSNPVVLGGDVHSYWVTDLKKDFADPSSPTIATEFVTSSITSSGPSAENVQTILAENPHVRYGRGDRRGYATLELTHDRCSVSFDTVNDVKVSDPATQKVASFVVENGRPGAQTP